MPKIDSTPTPAKATKPVKDKAGKPVAPVKSVKEQMAENKANRPKPLPPAQPPEPKAPKKKVKKFTIPDLPTEIKYEKKAAVSHVGDKALTCEQAKDLLGWIEETDTVKFDGHHFTDWNGVKIICTRNLGNRPFDAALARTYMADILNGRWCYNGDTIIITALALVASGQHRLIGFIWACQEWEKNKERWEHVWPEQPTMECLLAVGIEDKDEIINTIDSGKVRSLADTIFRGEAFAKLEDSQKKKRSKYLENAIKWLYFRTGAQPDALAPGKSTKRTHSESHDFLNRHPKLIEAVSHIHDEDADKGNVKRFMSCGYAAAYLFMMGCSASEPKDYQESESPNEDMLNWDNWDKALQFWSDLAGGAKELGAMRQALGDLIKEGRANTWTQTALICKAWPKYLNDEKITASDLEIEWDEDEETGAKTIAETPVIGGIDIGQPSESSAPTKADIDKEKEAIKLANVNGKTTKVKVELTIGDTVIVQYGGSPAWEGTLEKIVKNEAHVKDADGDIIEIPTDCVRRKVAVAKATPAKGKGK